VGAKLTVKVSEPFAATVAGRLTPLTLNAVVPVLIWEMMALAFPRLVITRV
jgi:hypothetical protein